MAKNSPFAESQEANIVKREKCIDDYLAILAKTKIRVPHPTALAKLVSKHVGAVEGKPCSHVTFLRNHRYLSKLLSHLAKHNGKPETSDADLPPSQRLRVVNSELELSNTKSENERLSLYCETLESEISRLKQSVGSNPPSAIMPVPIQSAPIPEHELNFVRTCQALRAVVSHFHKVVSLDMENGRILDASLRRNNIIVDSSFAKPFMEWLRTAN